MRQLGICDCCFSAYFIFIYIYIKKIPVKCLTDAFVANALFPEATLLVTTRGCTVFWNPLGFIFLIE